MSEVYRILAINPGSTSTKLALFENEKEVLSLNIPHMPEELDQFPSVAEQEEYRFSLVRDMMEEAEGHNYEELDAVIGRGGLLHPLEGGVYRVNRTMLDDLRRACYGEHASNLGAVLARKVVDELAARGHKCEAFIADPVVVDELCPEARFSGSPDLERKSIFHALNQKSVARNAADQLGKPYEELNLIVAHMGGGISVGAHRKGRVIDVNNALDGDGPFSPERSGGLPAGQLVQLVLSGKYSPARLKKMLTGQGGVMAYCGTKDMKLIEDQFQEGDSEAELVFTAMCYQISQEIARHGATLEGVIDGIVLTGGLANSAILVDMIKKRVSFLGHIFVIPGEREMVSLSNNALDALRGLQPVKEYK
jgi:butyrate kinase